MPRRRQPPPATPFAPEFSAPLTRVAQILERVERPGSFFTSWRIDGKLGEIKVPLSAATTKQLIPHATAAPYGHGEATIIDKSVRKTWQLEPSQFSLKNPQWQTHVVDTIATECARRMGVAVPETVQAKLYKLLIYEKGGKFELHQDSEKEPGMFGTLVIVLPTTFHGGELVVYPPGADTNSKSATPETWRPRVSAHSKEMAYTAFYGDCAHTVKPVTSGYRVCFTYNLIIPTSPSSSNATPQPYDQDVPELTEAMHQYFSTAHVDDEQRSYSWPPAPTTLRQPRVLTYVLDHQYTDAGLRDMNRLKNKDLAVAQRLLQVCNRIKTDAGVPKLEVYLCKVSFCFAYDPEYDYEDENDKERTVELQGKWQSIRGSWMDHSDDTITVKWKSELAPLGWFTKISHFDREERYYTGNEGARQEKWYKMSALVVIPTQVAQRRVIACGPSEIGSKLLPLEYPWPNMEKVETLHEFAKLAFIDRQYDWGTTSFYFNVCVGAIVKLDDVDLLAALLASVCLVEYQPELAKAVKHFGWAKSMPVILKAVEKRLKDWSARSRINFICSLVGVDKRLQDKDEETPVEVSEPSLAEVIDKVVCHTPPLSVTMPASYRKDAQIAKELKFSLVTEVDQIVRLFKSALIQPSAHASEALKKCTSLPGVDLVDTIVPAFFAFVKSTQGNGKKTKLKAPLPPAIATLGAALSEELTAKLPNVQSWKVEPAFEVPGEHCYTWMKCEDCVAMEEFLSSDAEQELRLRITGERRDHVVSLVKKYLKTVVGHTMDRQGRPHTLVISKLPVNAERLQASQLARQQIERLLS